MKASQLPRNVANPVTGGISINCFFQENHYYYILTPSDQSEAPQVLRVGQKSHKDEAVQVQAFHQNPIVVCSQEIDKQQDCHFATHLKRKVKQMKTHHTLRHKWSPMSQVITKTYWLRCNTSCDKLISCTRLEATAGFPPLSLLGCLIPCHEKSISTRLQWQAIDSFIMNVNMGRDVTRSITNYRTACGRVPSV